MQFKRQNEMIAYLLGRLPEKKQAELEAAFMADDSVFEELLTVEEELRDGYARGELPGIDRQDFEQRLLGTAGQRRRQSFAKALATRSKPSGRSAAGGPVERGGWNVPPLRLRAVLVPAFSAALLLLIVGGIWLTRRTHLPATPTENARGSRGGGEQVARKSTAEEQTITFALTSDVVRGSGQQLRAFTVPVGAGTVRLEASVQQEYESYAATLQTVEGAKIWSGDNLQSQRSSAGVKVIAPVPAVLLARGDYILTVRGAQANGQTETAGEYSFRIRKP